MMCWAGRIRGIWKTSVSLDEKAPESILNSLENVDIEAPLPADQAADLEGTFKGRYNWVIPDNWCCWTGLMASFYSEFKKGNHYPYAIEKVKIQSLEIGPALYAKDNSRQVV